MKIVQILLLAIILNNFILSLSDLRVLRGNHGNGRKLTRKDDPVKAAPAAPNAKAAPVAPIDPAGDANAGLKDAEFYE